jgi:hypothetical protein
MPSSRILSLAGLLFLFAAPPLHAQEPDRSPPIPVSADTSGAEVRVLGRDHTDQPSASLSGVVIAPDGTRLTAARVVLRGTPWGGPVDAEARFRYSSLPPGSYGVEVQRMGYRPARFTLRLEKGEAVRIAVALAAQPIVLQGVEATVERSGARSRMDEFHARRKRGRGYFFTRKDILLRQPRDLNELLVTVPRVRLVVVEGRHEIRMRGERPSAPQLRQRQRVVQVYGGRVFVPPPEDMRGGSGETNTSLSEGDCPPLYYVDGMSFDPTLGDLPEHVQPEEVEGVEIYEAGQVPTQFRQRGAECGAVIVWTRNRWNF